MANYRIIDKQRWPRKDHFDFYRGFANPSFNLCVPVEAQRLYECAKERGVSFFQLALYALVRAANGVPQLKQRQLGDDIGLSPAGLRYNGWTIAKRRDPAGPEEAPAV